MDVASAARTVRRDGQTQRVVQVLVQDEDEADDHADGPHVDGPIVHGCHYCADELLVELMNAFGMAAVQGLTAPPAPTPRTFDYRTASAEDRDRYDAALKRAAERGPTRAEAAAKREHEARVRQILTSGDVALRDPVERARVFRVQVREAHATLAAILPTVRKLCASRKVALTGAETDAMRHEVVSAWNAAVTARHWSLLPPLCEATGCGRPVLMRGTDRKRRAPSLRCSDICKNRAKSKTGMKAGRNAKIIRAEKRAAVRKRAKG